MKIFISWSGERGAQIGEVFNEYTPYIIHEAIIFFSPDADRGIRWFEEISKQLDETDVGIVCLTRDNIDSQWLLFESGALAKKMETSRLCTFLYDLKPPDISGPLALFNHTKNTKTGIKKLYQTLNNQREKPVDSKTFDKIFSQWWPEIEKELKSISKMENEELEPIRNEKEILEEILLNTRKLIFQKPISSAKITNRVIEKNDKDRLDYMIMDALADAPEINGFTIKDLAEATDTPWPTTRWHLEVLEGRGIVEHDKIGKAKVYRLKDKKEDTKE